MIGFIGEGLENVSASAGDQSNAPDLVESLNFPGYQEPDAEWEAASLNSVDISRGAGGGGGGGDGARSGDGSPPTSGLHIPWEGASWLANPAHSRLNAVAKQYWIGATRLMYVGVREHGNHPFRARLHGRLALSHGVGWVV